MSYPRLYSLSTVGVIKHYNQDYLLHKIRTDFTGKNGIGKSLIADLIQLIFINDKSKIVFGTDSLKKDKKLIHTLPYQTSDAYVFMNVEMKKDAFVTIGVNIPNQKSRPLRSFWVLNKAHKPEDSAQIEDLTMPKEKLLTYKDFLKNGTIPSIDKLIIHLRENSQVYLKHFTFKEQKTDFYRFLYEKKIISINLAIEDNLNTFAKIIQSFSKAKTLDTDDDNSLKDFLFENEEESLKKAYNTHQRTLSKLINDFNSLDKLSALISKKQTELTDLKALEEKHKSSQKTFFIAKYSSAIVKYRSQKEEEKKLSSKLNKDYDKEQRLKSSVEKNEKNAGNLFDKIEKGRVALDNLLAYEEIVNEIAEFEKELNVLSNLKIPNLKDESVYEIDIDFNDYHTSEIEKNINVFVPVYNKYGSLFNIEEKLNSQRNKVAKAKNYLGERQKALEATIDLLSLKKTGSLFSKLLQEGNNLSEAQETVFFSLLSNALTSKPLSTSQGIIYVDGTSILDKKNIVEDLENLGYWFATGKLTQFVPKTDAKRIFSDKNALIEASQQKSKELKNELENVKNTLENLTLFEQGANYSGDLLRNHIEDIDDTLIDYTAFNNLKTSYTIGKNINKKVSFINSEITKRMILVKEIGIDKKLKVTEKNVSQMVISHSEELQSLKDEESLLKLEITKDKNELGLLKEYIPRQKDLTKEATKKLASLKEEKENSLSKLKSSFPSIKTEAILIDKINDEKINKLEEASNKDNIAYASEYKSIINNYSEISEDAIINEQVKNSSFVFQVLESTLLGPKIGHLDNVPENLRKANRERHTMMENIVEAMLKIFKHTRKLYEKYENTITNLNNFFKGKKISQKYYFQIKFNPIKSFDIDWIEKLQNSSQRVSKPGELPFGDTVEDFVEDFFQKATNYSKKLKMVDLLNPRTYFKLETKFTDENNIEKPGSTGESYAAIVLLGIGRLSIVEDKNRNGIKFLILEEISNLDRTNFNAFPNLAKDFGYQIITMTPRPYGSENEDGWYLYHLIEGKNNADINYPTPNSYFKTNENKEDLVTFLKKIQS